MRGPSSRTVDDDRPLVIVGDVLLDVDTVGRAERLAPDAPVPVVAVDEERARPGGAGLAAVIAARLSPDRRVVLIAPIADDADGDRLRSLLADAGVDLIALAHRGRTTVKQRVIAQHRPLLRVDRGDRQAVVDHVPAEVRSAVQGAAAVLVSDYGGGTTGIEPIRAALSELSAPLVWDPHPRGTAPVPGVTLVTPNEAEMRALGEHVAGHTGEANGLAEVAASAAALVGQWHAAAVAVTLGSRGALLSRGVEAPPILTPVAQLGIESGTVDACGAGDCFAAAAALALAEGAVVPEAIEAAVAQSSRFVAAGGASGMAPLDAVGAAPGGVTEPERLMAPGDEDGLDGAVRLADAIRSDGGTVVATGGCFDLLHAGHVETLRAARSLGDCLIVLLNSDESVRRLKGPTRPLQSDHDRARVLASLDAVDAVAVFAEDTPAEALRLLRPHVWTKGGDYSGDQLPEAAVLAEWGGQVVVLPFLDGRSTTHLVRRAQYAGLANG